MFVVDFDETLTSHDTTHLVVECALSRQSEELRKRNAIRWRELSLDYSSKLKKMNENVNRLRKDPLFGIHQWSKLRKSVEENSISAVSESRIFANLNEEDLRLKGKSIPLLPGASEVIRSVNEQEIPCAVISIGWSREMIEGALYHQLNFLPAVEANRVDPETGVILGGLHCPKEKENRLKKLRTLHNAHQGTIYVGDSTFDVLALLEADLGILFRPSKETLQFCSDFNVEVRPLQLIRWDDYKKIEQVIYTTDDWSEIADCIKL